MSLPRPAATVALAVPVRDGLHRRDVEVRDRGRVVAVGGGDKDLGLEQDDEVGTRNDVRLPGARPDLERLERISGEFVPDGVDDHGES